MNSIPLPDFFPDPSAFLREELAALRRTGMLRALRDLRGEPGPSIRIGERQVLLLCSNNYLGLANDERVKAAARRAIEQYGTGATGARLISGNLDLYRSLETELAAFKGAEAALIFSSGYHANTGVIPALAGPGDALFSDALNHASIIDGARLSRAEIHIYRHSDPDDLERELRQGGAARRKLIVTESIFSMDGDRAPLGEIAGLAKKYGALLMVDEAHATGVIGPNGAGLVEELGLTDQVQVQMGTFSKALGSLGGFVAGSRELIDFLINRSRSFLFTTGLPPAVLAASAESLRIVEREPQRRAQLMEHARQLRAGLEKAGFTLGPSQSQILPVRIGDDRRAMAACRYLLRQGVFVQGVRPPTVPEGTARLRMAPMATHSSSQIAEALAAFEKLGSLLCAEKRKTKAAILAR